VNGPPDPAGVGTSPDSSVSDDPAAGLGEQEAAARAAAGRDDADRSRPSRTYADVLRTDVFTCFDDILFVIGAGLLALGRTNDTVNSAVQEIRAERTRDSLHLLHRSTATVVRDDVGSAAPVKSS
jgi:cation-transporting P-type ATPase E